MLDSLREQLKQEDEKQKVIGEDFKERSSSEFNMPFEINPRDSQNTGLRSSGLINVSTRQQKDKFGKQNGKNVIMDDGGLEEYKGVQSQNPVAKREQLFAHDHIEGVKLNDLSMSQKELPKKSEMCLADLEDSTEYKKKSSTNNLVNSKAIGRQRLPSESKCGESDS